MIKKIILGFLLFAFGFANAEESKQINKMTPEKMHAVIKELGTKVSFSGNMIKFEYDQTQLLCVFDVNANRMRIISGIAEVANVTSEELFTALVANFHTALDTRYAISNGIVYSAFIHPLQSLSEKELRSAIKQVARASNTFGTEYSSGGLYFPGDQQNEKGPTDKTDPEAI